jgi:hypothetical protein
MDKKTEAANRELENIRRQQKEASEKLDRIAEQQEGIRSTMSDTIWATMTRFFQQQNIPENGGGATRPAAVRNEDSSKKQRTNGEGDGAKDF